MAPRKTKVIQLEVSKAAEKLIEVQTLQAEAEKEEREKLESITRQIEDIAEQNEVLIGAVLSRQDLLAIIQMAFENPGANVTIPFRVYFKD